MQTPNVNGNPKRVPGLDITPAEGGCTVFEPSQNRIHFLNPTAVLVLELSTGRISPNEIAELVKEAYGLPEPPFDDVRNVLKHLKDGGLVL